MVAASPVLVVVAVASSAKVEVVSAMMRSGRVNVMAIASCLVLAIVLMWALMLVQTLHPPLSCCSRCTAASSGHRLILQVDKFDYRVRAGCDTLQRQLCTFCW